MDVIHHALIGGIGFIASIEESELAGMAFVAGSIFPDLDVIFMLFGKRFYLKQHQAITHSLFLSPLFAFLIISPTLFSSIFQWSFFIYAWLGVLIHIFLDYTNTYGIALLYPISDKRFSLDSIFFIDSVTLSLTFITYISYFLFQLDLSLPYFLSFILYLLFKISLRKRLKEMILFDFAIPSSLNPFEFYIYKKDNHSVKTYLYNSWNKSRRNIKIIDIVDDRYKNFTDKSQIFQDMRQITKAFHITNISETKQEIKIEASDLAVRNYGGKFGTTVLIFDNKGGLKSEVANI